jgi:ribonucleases P/MRP protein subunit RPP40
VLNGQSSDWEEVLSGVPQGSVLGPPLFPIYINDIDDIVRFIKILRKFADDTKLGNTVATPEYRGRLQLALTKLCEWARSWGMEFNIKKCKVMFLGHNNTEQAYFMEGQQLEVTQVERDIEVNVVKGLKQAGQYQKAARTAQGVLSQISRAFHYRERNVFLCLYLQYVRPHLEFASPVWSPWLEADKEVLEKVQRKAVNIISGLKAKTYEEKLWHRCTRSSQARTW